MKTNLLLYILYVITYLSLQKTYYNFFPKWVPFLETCGCWQLTGNKFTLILHKISCCCQRQLSILSAYLNFQFWFLSTCILHSNVWCILVCTDKLVHLCKMGLRSCHPPSLSCSLLDVLFKKCLYLSSVVTWTHFSI